MLKRLCPAVALIVSALFCAGQATVSLPVHPVTEATLREYFAVCHFAVRNREALETQFARQRKDLPPWYPRTAWNALVNQVEAIDTVTIALPVYRKYLSEETARKVIRLFVTPEGQAMIERIYNRSMQDISAGDSAGAARRKALDEARASENAESRRILSALTPAERRDIEQFLHSDEYRRYQGLTAQMTQEFVQAYVARQLEVAKEFTAAHIEELQKAKRDYAAAHPAALQ